MEIPSVVSSIALLESYSGWSWIGVFFTIIFGTGVLFKASELTVKYLHNKGYDSNRKLHLVLRFARMLILFAAFVYMIGKIYDQSQIYASYIALMLVATLLVAQHQTLSNLLYGFLGIFDAKIKLGHRISAPGFNGIVKEIRLLDVILEAENGASIFVPHATLARSSVAVTSVSGGHPIELRVEIDGENVTSDHLKNLGLASPFRKSLSQVEIERISFEDKGKMLVKFLVWSPHVINQAKKHYFKELEALVKKKISP